MRAGRRCTTATIRRWRHSCGNSLDQLDSTNIWALLSYFMAAAAELKGEHGDRESASMLLARAAELARLTGEQWCLPEITRLRARYDAVDAAESAAMLREALAVARMQDAKLWELRAATDLARLLCARGASTMRRVNCWRRSVRGTLKGRTAKIWPGHVKLCGWSNEESRVNRGRGGEE